MAASGASNKSRRLEERVKIDHQAHWYPPSYIKAMRDRPGSPTVERADGRDWFVSPASGRMPLAEHFTDLDLQWQDLETNGFDGAVISPAVLGDVGLLDASEATEMARLLNEEYAAAQAARPESMFALATLPLQDPAAAVAELDHAVGRLGLAGVLMHSNVGGRPICDPALEPVWERIADLGLNVVVHPTRSTMAPAFEQWHPKIDVMLAWLLDTSAAAVGLIVSGVLDRWPDIQVLHPHLGGTLPFITGRLDGTAAMAGLSRSPSWYLANRFWVDSSTHTPGAIELAVRAYGAERIAFGSDVPYLVREHHVNFLQSNVAPETAEAIMENRFPLRIGS